MTQCQRLKEYLETHDGIDPITAWTELGIYRLGARVFDLKKQGNMITKADKTVRNRWGEKCVVAYYFLLSETQQKGQYNGV